MRLRSMAKFWGLAALITGVLSPAAQAVIINFDEDAGGAPLVAPAVFIDTTALTDLYAPLGVTFMGPGGLDGGAILDEAGNFGVDARSGDNFLAFNRFATMSDGGVPQDPEMILFAAPVTSVSIFASGGFNAASFEMSAFDAFDVLVDFDSIATAVGVYGQLSVSHAGGIAKITLVEIDEANAFVYDDLEFELESVPEPATVLLLALGLSGVVGVRRKLHNKLG